MCEGCWEEHGSPREIPAGAEDLVETAKSLDHYGGLHIVVDDWNIEDHHIEFSRDYPTTKDYEKEWCQRMLALTIPQRAAVLAKAEGYFGKNTSMMCVDQRSKHLSRILRRLLWQELRLAYTYYGVICLGPPAVSNG